MSWGMSYQLPWRNLDFVQVEAAAREVAMTLPGVLLELDAETDFPEKITCYFGIPLSLAREMELTPSDLDEKIASAGELGIADPPWVQIDFVAEDEDWPQGSGAYCRFEFDTSDSGNGLCTGAVCEIAARFGRHFGVQGQSSW